MILPDLSFPKLSTAMLCAQVLKQAGRVLSKQPTHPDRLPLGPSSFAVLGFRPFYGVPCTPLIQPPGLQLLLFTYQPLQVDTCMSSPSSDALLSCKLCFLQGAIPCDPL